MVTGLVYLCRSSSWFWNLPEPRFRICPPLRGAGGFFAHDPRLVGYQSTTAHMFLAAFRAPGLWLEVAFTAGLASAPCPTKPAPWPDSALLGEYSSARPLTTLSLPSLIPIRHAEATSHLPRGYFGIVIGDGDCASIEAASIRTDCDREQPYCIC